MSSHEGDLDILARLRRQLAETAADGDARSGGRSFADALPSATHIHTGNHFAPPPDSSALGYMLETPYPAQRYDTAMEVLRQLAESAPGGGGDASGSASLAHAPNYAAARPQHSQAPYSGGDDGLPPGFLAPYRQSMSAFQQGGDAQRSNFPNAFNGIGDRQFFPNGSYNPTVHSLASLYAEQQPRTPAFQPTSGAPGPRTQVPAPRAVQTGAMPRMMPSVAAVLQSPGTPLPLDRSASASTVLAAKVLTESDIKHSRAILPRIAVENNLPFVIGYRTYGLRIPDSLGNEWEMIIKSWANGRSESAPLHQKRRRDRRVFVLEGIASFLKAHQLKVGDVFGIVVENDKLTLHARTAALKTWTERPTYGAPALDVSGQVIDSKCTKLEGAALASMMEKCARSAACQKPAGHTGDCFSSNMLVKTPPRVQEAPALTFWPPPTEEAEQIGDDPATYRELAAADVLEGPVLCVRLSAEDVVSGEIYMPPGAAIKVPAAFARAGALRLAARGEDQSFEVFMRATPDAGGSTSSEAVQDVIRLPAWRIGNLAPVFEALQVHTGDELCFVREAGSILVRSTPYMNTHPQPAAATVILLGQLTAFGTRLCDRNQGCMKPLQHAGFCSGHKGAKRKDSSDQLVALPCKLSRRQALPSKRKCASEDDDWVPSTRELARTPPVQIGQPLGAVDHTWN